MVSVDMMFCGERSRVGSGDSSSLRHDGKNDHDHITEKIKIFFQPFQCVCVCVCVLLSVAMCISKPDELSLLSCRLITLLGLVPLLMKSSLSLLPTLRWEEESKGSRWETEKRRHE